MPQLICISLPYISTARGTVSAFSKIGFGWLPLLYYWFVVGGVVCGCLCDLVFGCFGLGWLRVL